MSDWNDINDEDLYKLHELLGIATSIKLDDEEQTFSEILDELNVLRRFLGKLSDGFIVNISNKIAEMIHERAKRSVESQENT